jgi:hypothetical protein
MLKMCRAIRTANARLALVALSMLALAAHTAETRDDLTDWAGRAPPARPPDPGEVLASLEACPEAFQHRIDPETGAPVNESGPLECRVRRDGSGRAIGPDGIHGTDDDGFPSVGNCLLWENPASATAQQTIRQEELVVLSHPVNQMLFHALCTANFDSNQGFCPLDVLNHRWFFDFFSEALVGNPLAGWLATDGLHRIRIRSAPHNHWIQAPGEVLFRKAATAGGVNGDLGNLTPEQQALLGCGPAFASPCGVDQKQDWVAPGDPNDPRTDFSIGDAIDRDLSTISGGPDLMNADGTVTTQELVLLKEGGSHQLVGARSDPNGHRYFEAGISSGGMSPDEVIGLGTDGRNEFVRLQNEIARRNRLDPNDPEYLDPAAVSPTATDAWVEPLPWLPDPNLLAQGILVYQMANRFELDPRCHRYEDPELAGHYRPRDPACVDAFGNRIAEEVFNDPTDATNPLNVFRTDSEGRVVGEICVVGLGGGVFDAGCTELEKVVANLERLTIALEIVGPDRSPDPPESMQELMNVLSGNDLQLDGYSSPTSGDPISGRDGIFTANYASGLGNLVTPHRFAVDSELGDEVDVQAIRLLDPFAETIDLRTPEAKEAFMASNAMAEECEEGAVCYAVLGIDEQRVDLGGFENPETPGTVPLAVVLPAAMPIQGNAVDPTTGGRVWIDDPNTGETRPGLDDPSIPSHINFLKLYYQDPVLAMRLLDRTDLGDDPDGFLTIGYFKVAIDGEMYWIRLNPSISPETFYGAEDGNQTGCQDLDRDGQCDWDEDHDHVYDGIDDDSRGPATDDNLFCGTGFPGDVPQEAIQLELFSPAEQRLLQEMFPSGLPPRSPAFCQASAFLLAMTGASSPDRRDFLWHGGHGLDDTDADGWPDDLDNCADLPNPCQEDTGGLASTTPDGIGTMCQCGDVDGNGTANSGDSTLIKRAAAGLPPFPSSEELPIPGNCDVDGNGACDADDGTIITRNALGLPPCAPGVTETDHGCAGPTLVEAQLCPNANPES